MTILRDLQERHFLSRKLRGHSTTLKQFERGKLDREKSNTVHTSFKPTKTSISFLVTPHPAGHRFLKKRHYNESFSLKSVVVNYINTSNPRVLLSHASCPRELFVLPTTKSKRRAILLRLERSIPYYTPHIRPQPSPNLPYQAPTYHIRPHVY